MKRIKEYKGNSFEFHQKVIASKHSKPTDPTYKDRVNALHTTVREQFENHDNKFSENDLGTLSAKELDASQKRDLQALYDYGTKPFQQLNDILTTSENGARQPICPFCTINNVNTFDHLIPKSEFSELADHPVNLMPCCSQCNGKKSSNWRIGNERKYLNLYLDDLPNLQYLFIYLLIEGRTLNVRFTVENKYGIDSNLFIRIQNHYHDLNLCHRFSLNSDNVISELKNTLEFNKEYISKEQLKKNIINAENKNREQYGFNYWKSLLKIECCRDDTIFSFLIK